MTGLARVSPFAPAFSRPPPQLSGWSCSLGARRLSAGWLCLRSWGSLLLGRFSSAAWQVAPGSKRGPRFGPSSCVACSLPPVCFASCVCSSALLALFSGFLLFALSFSSFLWFCLAVSFLFCSSLCWLVSAWWEFFICSSPFCLFSFPLRRSFYLPLSVGYEYLLLSI